MKKRIILLTKSRKYGGYCTAGIDIENGQWVRIVSDGCGCISNEILDCHIMYNNGSMAEILDIIEVECKKYSPNYYQPENYVIDSSKWIRKIGRATMDEVLKIHPFENRDYIFYNMSYKVYHDEIFSIDEKDRYSLILIKTTQPQINVKTWADGGKNVTLCFNYNYICYKFFRITEGLENEYKLKPDGTYILPGDYALVISLGELYKDNYHYKLVSKIFPLKKKVSSYVSTHRKISIEEILKW